MTDFSIDIPHYRYWCDGSCYHVSSDNWMGLGIYQIEYMGTPNSVRKLAIEAPKGDHNMAEYLAILCAMTDLYILEGMKYSKDMKYADFNSDSQLVIRQITGIYAVRTINNAFLLSRIKIMFWKLQDINVFVRFNWCPRTDANQQVADWLSKVGNRHFNEYVATKEVTHGITNISDALLPNHYRQLKRRFNWRAEDSI